MQDAGLLTAEHERSLQVYDQGNVLFLGKFYGRISQMTFQAKRVSDIAKNHSGGGGGGGVYRKHFDSWNAGADVFIWSLHFGIGKSI